MAGGRILAVSHLGPLLEEVVQAQGMTGDCGEGGWSGGSAWVGVGGAVHICYFGGQFLLRGSVEGHVSWGTRVGPGQVLHSGCGV